MRQYAIVPLIEDKTFNDVGLCHQSKYQGILFLFELDLFVCVDDDYVTRVTVLVSSNGQS